MDGVIADTGLFHYLSWVKMANQIGKEFTKEMFDATFGQKSIPITRLLVGSKPENHIVEKWAALKETYYREMIKDNLEPLPNSINLIKELKNSNFKLAIGSSGPPENVNLLLTTLKIKQFFDVIITAIDIKDGKPAPDVFLEASRRLKRAPKNCLVIEDAPVGIMAAKNAGMKCIALTTTHNKARLNNADLIIKDLSKINLQDIINLLEE